MEGMFVYGIAFFVGLMVCLSFVMGQYTKRRILDKKERHLHELTVKFEKSLTEKEIQVRQYNESIEGIKKQWMQSRDRELDLERKLVRAETELRQKEGLISQQKEDYKQLHERMRGEFELLSEKIFRDQAGRLSDNQQMRIGELLTPLQKRIEKFEDTVQKIHLAEIQEQASLRAELKHLHDLNQKITHEAKQLTHALKGDVKSQGNWGEFVLEKVMERSGLRKDVEFKREVVITNAEQKTYRPDVIVYLPDKKHLVVDSKVSLVAYNKSVNNDDVLLRNKYIKEHLQSVRNHIKLLSEKKYFMGVEIESPEFVLLFMPIESAFSAAIEADQELFSYAWEQQVILVSPTTLLATLRTVASLWKHEKQTNNALLIAQEGGRLYDRIALFLQEFERLEKPLLAAQTSYNYLRDKFVVNKQSLYHSAKKLEQLGVKKTKELPEQYADE